MKLYQEIIFLKNWFKGKWNVENVKPYYEDILIPYSKEIGRHLFWSNFKISDFDSNDGDIHKGVETEWIKLHGFDLSGFKINSKKNQIYRNCVHPETGLHILDCAREIFNRKKQIQKSLFDIYDII